MEKWYNNSELTNLAQACDDALDISDIEKLLELVDSCESKANNNDMNPILSAQYLYCAFTSCNAVANLSKKKANSNYKPNDTDIVYERSIHIARKAVEIYDSILSKKNSISKHQQNHHIFCSRHWLFTIIFSLPCKLSMRFVRWHSSYVTRYFVFHVCIRVCCFLLIA